MGVVIVWHPLAILGWIATMACFVGAGLCFGLVLDAIDDAQPIEQGADENTDLEGMNHGA